MFLTGNLELARLNDLSGWINHMINVDTPVEIVQVNSNF